MGQVGDLLLAALLAGGGVVLLGLVGHVVRLLRQVLGQLAGVQHVIGVGVYKAQVLGQPTLTLPCQPLELQGETKGIYFKRR